MKKCTAVIQIVACLILMVFLMGGAGMLVMADPSGISLPGITDPACCSPRSSATYTTESVLNVAIAAAGALLLL